MDSISLVLDQLEALRSDALNFSYPQHLLERWKTLTNDLVACYEQRRYNFEQQQTHFTQRQAFFEQQQIRFEQRRMQFEQQQTAWHTHFCSGETPQGQDSSSREDFPEPVP